MIYLDYNATSPLRPEARAAVQAVLAEAGNPSSVHAAGRDARRRIEEARGQVAALVCARSEDVIFTSGGTEANTLGLCGAVFGAAEAGERILRLFVSAIEHPSVLANAERMAESAAGLKLTVLPVSNDGVVEVDALRSNLREGRGRALVVVMAANNETGVVQPIADVVRVAHEAGALVMVDAVQSAGWTRADSTGIDFLTLSAHKIGGPQGAGALVVRECAPMSPLFAGGGQERGLRAGTENVLGVAGFGAAARAVSLENCGLRVRALRDRFERSLKAAVPGAVVFGENAERLAGTSNFALPKIPAETALIALDLDGIQVSSGAACSSGKVEASHVLAAMGVPTPLARRALRVSFGFLSRESDADRAIESITNLCARVSARAA